MPRHDPLVRASMSSALANDAFILEELGLYPRPRKGSSRGS
jgi:hypothetical protein